ncbi:MAG: YicC/YloC family endoribonuclease [Pseudomonadota bacterium]
MKSMTGYAAIDLDGRRWEMRGVNGRGLDLRFRLPEQPAGLEPLAREMLTKAVARGNVTLTLRLSASEGQGAALNADGFSAALDALATVQDGAQARGITLAPTSAAEVLAIRGVWEAQDAGTGLTLDGFRADLSDLLAAFDATRVSEGARLRDVLRDHVDQIANLTLEAEALAPDRATHMAETYRAAVARLTADVEDTRIVQEIATLAVKGDVTEEIDRLRTHVAAARDLLAAKGPVGRRLDFLTQEFNREANTLCSKAQMSELTRIGLDLKTVIDRLREQVQNVE